MDTTQTSSSIVIVNGRALRLRPANREDVIPVPVRLQDLLPPDHMACRVWEMVGQLDLSEFYADIEVEEGTRGAPATDPRILVAVWIYTTLPGETSARHVETLCVEHLAYIWLCGGVTMNYHTLSDFRVDHEGALDRLFTQIVQQLAEAGLIEFKAHAQDGMRVRASAACLRASACASTHADRYTHRQGAASFHRQATLEKALARATAEQETLRQSETGETSWRAARECAAQERAVSERIARLEAALTELPAVQAAKPVAERAEARVSSTDLSADRQARRRG